MTVARLEAHQPRTVDVDGATITYVDEGSGPALLLVHGLGGSGWWWQPVIADLARDFRVIAPDLPGFGGPDALTPQGAITRQATALWRLVDRLGVDDVTVVGHSLGGLISQRLAIIAPARVRRLMLVSSGGAALSRQRRLVLTSGFLLAHSLLSVPRLGHRVTCSRGRCTTRRRCQRGLPSVCSTVSSARDSATP